MNKHSSEALAPAARWHGLDAVRGFALLLGVILHASMSFLPGAQYFWVASDSDQSITAAVIFYVIHNFRMITFFLLAGFFARMAFHRLGLRSFARDRWTRIGKPLLIGWPILFSAIVAALAWGAMLKNGGSLPKETPPGPSFMPNDFPLTHLWFLYALALFYIVGLALRAVLVVGDKNTRLRQQIDRVVRVVMGWCAPLLLALPVAISLFYQAQWYSWFGIPTPDHSLYLNVPAIVGFGSAFVFGWLLHRQPDLLLRLQSRWAFYLLVAVATTTLSLYLIGLTPALKPATPDLDTLIYALSYCTAAWSWTFVFIGMALRFLSQHSITRRYLSDASYWIYLVHLPLIMALQIAASRFELSWAIELPLMLVLAFIVMLLSYHLMVRNSMIGATLNGRRQRDSAAKTATPTVVSSFGSETP